MEKVIKTAIAIPRMEYQQIEQLRARTGKTRSRLLMEAFREWLDHREKLAMERRYAEGYKRHPEKLAELAPLLQAGLAAWEKESWK
jgi:predicted DNA-binding protein